MRALLVVGVTAVVGVTSVGYAQQRPDQGLPNARPVWENARGAAIAARTPGRMVRQGTARFNDAHTAAMNHIRSGPEITETAPEDPVPQLKADLLEIIFRDLNLLIQALATMQGGDGGGNGGDGTTPDDEPVPDLSDLIGTISRAGS